MKMKIAILVLVMSLPVPGSLIGAGESTVERTPVSAGQAGWASAAEQNTDKVNGNINGQSAMQFAEQSIEVNRRSAMILNTEISRSDPSVVLGLREDLALSGDQVLVLKALAAVARQKTRSVLSDDQRAQLDVLPSAPESMKAVHERMMAELPVMDVSQSSPDEMDSCPVFQMMMEELEAVLSEMADHRH